MEEYDEDLSENSWYLAFIHNHNKLFLDVTSERWIVCVPRSGSWKGGGDAPKVFNSSHFESHCMKYDGEEIIPQRKDGDVTIPAKHISKYSTVNGKTLLVEGSRMTCGNGFEEPATSFDSKSGLLDLPRSSLNHTAKILFEETYFNADDQSYKMLCVSRPLELHLTLMRDSDDTSLETWGVSKLHGGQLWSRIGKQTKLKKNIDARINVYIKSHGSGKTTAEQTSSHAQNRGETWEMDEISAVDACEASVNALFNTCLDMVMKDTKIKKEIEANSFDCAKSALEKYVLQEVHGSVFRQIGSSVACQEASFNKTICGSSDIKPRDLDIDERYWPSLSRAKRRLTRINKYCTPQDKLSCLQLTVSGITAKQGALGSDDLLPILIYLVIKSNIPNWITNLVYLQRFQLVPTSKEQRSFHVTTLEAAVEHIKRGGLKTCRVAVVNTGKSELSPIQKYFECVRTGNVSAVKEVLSNSANERKERERKMCHPLCSCEKCSKFKRRSTMRSEAAVTAHTRDDKGQTALHLASATGRHELVDLLVEHGAELNAADYLGSNPLHCAALNGSQSVVFLLLHHGADPNATDNNDNTPLHLCSQRGHEACTKAFLYFDPTSFVEAVSMQNDEGDTPLHIAAKWGHVGIVSALIECGADPKAKNRRGQSSVEVSLNENVSSAIRTAANQVVKIVRTLKHLQPAKEIEESPRKLQEKKRARSRTSAPKELDATIDSAFVARQVERLLRAVNDGDVNMVQFLCGWKTVEEGETSKLDDPPCHPLCQCVKCRPLAPEHVLHANSSNQDKYTGLMCAAQNGYLEMARLFLERGASVNGRTKRRGYSPLHFACENGNAEVVEHLLMQEHVNPDVRDECGSTPLYLCASRNFSDCAAALLESNASVNIRNRNGDTPLHVAVQAKHLEVIEVFLDHGALVYYRNNDSLTPLDLAQKDPGIKCLLLSAASSPGTAASPTEEVSLGVSPHSPFLVVRNHSADGNSTPGSGPARSESLDDEAIADNLYAKFKDPAPPTPPISEQGSDAQYFASADEGSVDDATRRPKSPCFVRKHRSSKSATSDIFRDLLSTVDPSSTVGSVEVKVETDLLLGKEGAENVTPSTAGKLLQPAGEQEAAEPLADEGSRSVGDTYFEIG